jgi:hypothetical protein
LEINPGGLLFVVLQLQSVGLKQVITINELFFNPGLPSVLYIFKKIRVNYHKKINLLCYIDMPLQVSATNSHSEAVKIYKCKITINSVLQL